MLILQDIAVTYQNVVPAVQGISLEVPDKAVVALLGANGAGKTTIMRAIFGLLDIDKTSIVRGTILFDGERIDRLNTTQIVQRGISQVLEGRRLFADLTVEENLRTGAIATRDAVSVRRAYDRVMDLFPVLRERRKSHAGYLSGGEQQMLAIGRGLMSDPKLLLLDEPSLGLAPFMVQQIRTIISEINAGGTAVLLVEQNAQMDVAFQVQPGELFAVIGPNGAGKTSLFNVLSRVYQPVTGRVTFDGRDLLRFKTHQVARIGIARTFQNLGQFPTMTVLDYLLLGRHTRMRSGIVLGGIYFGLTRNEEKRNRAYCLHVLELVGLQRLQDHPLGSLPYGLQKRAD